MAEVRACTVCTPHLPFAPNPVLRAAVSSRLLIVGQAPGTKVHKTSIPWNDPSGDKLREWLALDKETFYDESLIAILPMGFCYPGKGKSGDLPPRKECAELWREQLLDCLPNIKLTLLIGQYAQRYHLDNAKKNLTETVRCWREYLPEYFPTPHPSPRNKLWLMRNPWFEHEAVPELRSLVKGILAGA